MIKKSLLNQLAKVKNASLLSALANYLFTPSSREHTLFFLLVFLLPTQLGKHFWVDFSFVQGLRIDYLSPTLYLTDIVIIALFLHWFIRTRPWDSIATSWWIVVLALLLGRSLFVPYPLLSLYFCYKFVAMVFVGYYTAQYLQTAKQWYRFCFVLSFAVGFTAVLGIGQYLQQGSLNGIFYWVGERFFTSTTPGIANASINGALILRPYATLPHPNVLAAYLLVGMACLWSSLGATSVKRKVWFCVIIFFAFVALLLSMSRATVLAGVLVTVIVLVRWYKKQILFPAFFFAFFLGVFIALPYPFMQRIIHISFAEESVTVRQYLFSAALSVFQSAPLLGVGLGHFLHHLPVSYSLASLFTAIQPVHNVYLFLLTEVGLLGIMFVVYFLWKTLLQIQKKSDARMVKICLLFILLFTGLLDHYWLTVQQGQLLTAVIFGICWASLRKTTH